MQRYIIQLTFLLLAFFLPMENARAKTESGKPFTVVIDAGHGGKDIGASDNGVMEKNINLKVAKQLENLIKKKMKDTKVVMTRDDDTYLTLQQRADKANKAKGDIFISIHTNSVDKSNKNRQNVAGSSVYTLGLHKDEDNLQVAMRENAVIELENNYEQKYSGFDPQKDESYIIFEMAQKKNLSQSIKFADNIQKELVGTGREDRGVHQAGFWVLWATSMPAVLVELDFICNPESARYLSSDQGSKELAEAIYNAVERYGSSLAGTSLVNVPSEKIENSGEVTVANKKKKNSTQSQRKKKKTTTTSSKKSDVVETAIIEEPISSSISEVAVAKTRKESRQHLASNSQKNVTNQRRRRRSNNSRRLSMANDYETSNIKSGGAKKLVEPLETPDAKEELMAKADKKNSKKKEKKKTSKEKTKKEKKEKTVKKERVSKYNAKVTKMVTVYKIQVLASEDYLSQNSSRFCGLSPITSYKENNLYKYYYGESTDRSEMESMLPYVREKIPDAFIVSSKKSLQ